MFTKIEIIFVKKNMKRVIIIVLFTILVLNLTAQKSKLNAADLYNDLTGFNFFTGKSAQNFQTTPKALGSGIYDLSNQYGIFPWILNPAKKSIGLSVGVAYKLSKYRFSDNWVFSADSIFIDNDPTHGYNSMFFSRQGSKLVVGKITIPIIVYLPVSKWFGDKKNIFGIYGSAFYDGFLFAYNKDYYEINGVLQKVKIKNYQIKDYFNKNFYGVRLGLKLGNILLFGQHTFVPLFKNSNYELFENKIGINLIFNYDTKKLLEDHNLLNETETK